ncbi:unnamed protein product [Mytilus coruscus]|uniref:DZIP3-like HEPN domain-containing protein n=1 Tax=Mytilus coruscus TaxID=42192 RepID=A0A6J8BVC2_MYTCO|nr:unnamed protein product [Mytilus coruscus]
MTNVSFDKKWECGLTKPEYVTGSNKFRDVLITEYYCETCTATHKSKEEWSDLQSQELCLFQSSADASESYPQMETTSKCKKQMFTTKVRWNVHGGMTTFAGVSEESIKTCSLTGLTGQEINFTKMGMIVLNILVDALYDLLKQDKPNLPLRSNCDITYLYNELRNLNKHIPSNYWGGTWQIIQVTDIAIGDDIERIRLTRNEIQHSRTFTLDDKRFNDLHHMIVDLVKRFDQHNKPARLYTDHLNDIFAKGVSEEEVKVLKHQIINEIKSGNFAFI